jgi:hypothetical protein
MMSIGTMSKAPPETAMIVLAIILTVREIIFGRWPRKYSKYLSDFLAFEYVRNRRRDELKIRPSRLDAVLAFGNRQYTL